MKIGIYDPYLDTLGGGEKYILTIAECLSEKNNVFIFWDKKETIINGARRFGLHLSKVKTTPNIFNSTLIVKKLIETRKYDLIIFISDGSIPVLLSKRSFVIFQYPVNWVNSNDFINRLKLANISGIICYSEFVKRYLINSFKTKIHVLKPSVNIIFNEKQKKENLILSVGRFTQGMNRKKQEVMIEVFKKIYKKNTNWKLVLVGGAMSQDMEFVEILRKKSRGFPIDILINISLDDLKSIYLKSKIYWHAAGFGEDLEAHPEFAEHFGISTVEAMGAGAVPVVINAGGQKEIVEDGKSGFLWNSVQELTEYTLELIEDNILLEKMSKQAQERAGIFAGDRFCKDLNRMLGK